MSRVREPGLRIIIAYKLLRAAIAFGASALLAGFIATGHGPALRAWADELRQHMSSHWSSALAQIFVTATTPRRLWLAVAALAFDGALVFAEGFALWRGYTWGAWLVVASTAALLPFEAAGLWRHPRLGRLLLLLGNLAVAIYLVLRVLRRRRPPHATAKG